jgi:tRNA (guanine37-N1)-methyltransferase
MRFDIVTIFPGFFAGPFDHGIVRRAREAAIAEVNVHDLRSWTSDRHHVVDDRPFGGGAGMVLKPEPLVAAAESLRIDPERGRALVALTSPQGTLFDQHGARRLAGYDQIIVLCGRYEGVDERVVEAVVDEEISIGDVILSGGELAACVVVDAVVRLLPGALGCEQSAREDSFAADGLLDFPHYTRPAEFRGLCVPSVLLGGNHAEIARWRRRQALERTLRRRPELLERADLTDEDRCGLGEMRARIQDHISIRQKPARGGENNECH